MTAPAPASAARRPIAGWLAIALAIIVLDQITKIVFDNLLGYGERLAILPFFDFTLLYNRGAAFSFLAQHDGWQRWFFTGLGLLASAFIVWLMRRHAEQRGFCMALTLILGGALGNVIDRLAYGHVVDFLLFHWNERYFPAFNLADTAITCGAILLILDELRRARAERRAQPTGSD
ncbi:lipoprotein signal peptidase [Verticiella sediminum]|uniref:Lipoprotein signal peptidase n=1 Tax=Verticiella sediminum TaxID=1247510 RepID=A0A556A6D6_9BURK|nr:signal peptidase II [Verticiella sediminum]TSH88437.1 lipoprotein signal peptidase [Verticiella sediminum]